MSFTQTPATTAAMLAGVLALLDNDTDPAYAVLFDAASNPLVTVIFDQPAGAIVAGQLVFAQGDPAGDLIAASGTAVSFTLHAGDGTNMGAGDVTDAAGTGAMKLEGSTGTTIYAGGRLVINELTMG